MRLFLMIIAFFRANIAFAEDSLNIPILADRLWGNYKYNNVEGGRIVARDENNITTSEGQSYGLLRSVWANDREGFAEIWTWTKKHLQVRRHDKLFAWKWRGQILDYNSATDADVDIALALLIAGRRFETSEYYDEAKKIIIDIRNEEIVHTNSDYYVVAGNWTKDDVYPKIHLGYFAPYAYQEFINVDPGFPWKRVIESSYKILDYIFVKKGHQFPPEFVFLDKKKSTLLLKHPFTRQSASFSYDAFPLYWRIALDFSWNFRFDQSMKRHLLAPLKAQWQHNGGKIFDRYNIEGSPLSQNEGEPLYAAMLALAMSEDPELGEEILNSKLRPYAVRLDSGEGLPYYLSNWLGLGLMQTAGLTLSYNEFFVFLRPFDWHRFRKYLAYEWILITLSLFVVGYVSHWANLLFIVSAICLSIRYLNWRLTHTLNFHETSGPFLSTALWVAEAYCFLTIVLLMIQVGLRRQTKSKIIPQDTNFDPSVDILIPIFSEPLSILESTLIGACGIDYKNKTVFVCDDSHRDEVQILAESYGAVYVKGPKKHAKAGNINNALQFSKADLVVIFDTDHIPCRSFLTKTVPLFTNPRLGVVQTPHAFYNEDIFQRTFFAKRTIPNEQDMFNHGIQARRNCWGGAFFVGSGAVFRRQAINDVGGLNYLSITEDIHTCQKIHAKGWESAFVDENLALGLSAENYSSYLIQRRRWMLGCLQIFIKDNPILQKGLSIRQKLGYFSSHFYFLFPLAAAVFWFAPISYLLFHWHPLLADVSELLAYQIPFYLMGILLNDRLLPGWSRPIWGSIYEASISFPLFRAMFDLFLPKNLGFKVTPKGVVSTKRTFDLTGMRINLLVLGISLFAIGKGLFEFYYFGIEKDAYFFNLISAGITAGLILISLLLGWERPQRRIEERLALKIPITISTENAKINAYTHDISLTGCSIILDKEIEGEISQVDIRFQNQSLSTQARTIYCDRSQGKIRIGLHFEELPHSAKKIYIQNTFADEFLWRLHHIRSGFRIPMVFAFFTGLVKALLHREKTLKRLSPRRLQFKVCKINHRDSVFRGFLINRSASGVGFIARDALDLYPNDLVMYSIGKTNEVRLKIIHTHKNILGFTYIGAMRWS